MPLRHKSAQKRARQTVGRTDYNKHYKAKVKRVIKDVLSANQKEDAEKKLRLAVQTLDRATTKGIMHRNNAAHKKSKLSMRVNKLS